MTKKELSRYISRQIDHIFGYDIDMDIYLSQAEYEISKCFEASSNKHFVGGDIENISVYNSVQYCIVLYILANTAYKLDGDGHNAEKLYYLNKVLNSVDIFYTVEMPEIWGCEHPLSAVMEHAKFGDYFYFYQGCTVGGNYDNYPIIGNNVRMYSNSTIVGDSVIGNNVIISANTYIKDATIPDNCIVFGQSPNITIKKKTKENIWNMNRDIWK